jgi:hypothetical protein
MLELVDGIIATGESAFRPGRATTETDDTVIDPELLAESENMRRSQSTAPDHASKADSSSASDSDRSIKVRTEPRHYIVV